MTVIRRNGEVIKYHTFISVVVIELSVRCLSTGPEDKLTISLSSDPVLRHLTDSSITTSEINTMLLYYFPFAQNTANKTLSENIYRGLCLYKLRCAHILLFFLFTGFRPV